MIRVSAICLLLACTPSTSPALEPSRVEIQSAATAAWNALEPLGHDCAHEVRYLVARGDPGFAEELGNACLMVAEMAEQAHGLIVETLEAPWTPASAARVGCFAKGLVSGYDGLLKVLAETGYQASEATLQGRESAEWLARKCVVTVMQEKRR